MVNANITGAHPSCNNEGDDASCLIDFFRALFKHYTSCTSPMMEDCIRSLRILAGLGFTVCLLDDVYTACYQPHLTDFLKYDRGDFYKHPGASEILANDIARMILLSLKSFQKQHHSVCYKEFMNIIESIVGNVVVVEIDKKREAHQILELLQQGKKANLSYFPP